MKQQIAHANLSEIAHPELKNPDLDCSLAGYDYTLPPELIAQNPVFPRDSSQLLVINAPSTGQETAPLHHIFRDLPELLRIGDLLVINNTKVIPARLYGRKSTGAEIEVLLLEERQNNCWLALVKPGKRFKLGATITFEPRGNKENSSPVHRPLIATVLETDPATGGRLLQFDLPVGQSLVSVLDEFGEIPLPPYITASTAADEQYQTVYAQQPGAIAAPTAGLHFTPELLEKLRDRGIHQADISPGRSRRCNYSSNA
jgi:S-adenosylmethionine:tRNA ribosyltransferase-isomerase